MKAEIEHFDLVFPIEFGSSMVPLDRAGSHRWRLRDRHRDREVRFDPSEEELPRLFLRGHHKALPTPVAPFRRRALKISYESGHLTQTVDTGFVTVTLSPSLISSAVSSPHSRFGWRPRRLPFRT